MRVDIGVLAQSLDNIWLRTKNLSDSPLELTGIQFVDETGKPRVFDEFQGSTGGISLTNTWQSLHGLWEAATGLDYNDWKDRVYAGMLPVMVPKEIEVRFQEPTPVDTAAQHTANLWLVLGRVPPIYAEHYTFLRQAGALEYPRLEWYALIGDTSSSVLSGFFVDSTGKRTGAAFTATLTTSAAQDFATMFGAAVPIDATGVIIYLTENVRVEISDADTRIADLQTNKAKHPVLNSGEIIPLAGVF